MKSPVYKKLAIATAARLTCEKQGNWEWFGKWEDDIKRICDDYLPHGSGIDDGCSFNFTSRPNSLLIESGYHAMNENGYYDRWIDFTVRVTPSLAFDFDLLIKGNFGKYQDCKDSLYDLFHTALSEEVDD
jgi:hypothetical protein